MLKLGLAFVTAVLLLNALGTRGLPAVLQARRSYQQDERELDRLKADNAALRQQVKRLRVDSATVEEVARRDLGFIAPGEKVFIIHDVTPNDAAPPAPAPRPPDASPAP